LSLQATWRRANAGTGLLRNSNAAVATYFCSLNVRIIRRILFRIFGIAAYVSSLISVRNIYCADRHKRPLKCTWSNTLQARRQTFVRFVNSPPKMRIYESKQNPYNETKARK